MLSERLQIVCFSGVGWEKCDDDGSCIGRLPMYKVENATLEVCHRCIIL